MSTTTFSTPVRSGDLGEINTIADSTFGTGQNTLAGSRAIRSNRAMHDIATEIGPYASSPASAVRRSATSFWTVHAKRSKRMSPTNRSRSNGVAI